MSASPSTGNAFAFLIYYRKRDKGTSTIFILSLAVTDFITCLIMIPFTIAIELLLYKLTFQVFCKVSKGFKPLEGLSFLYGSTR